MTKTIFAIALGAAMISTPALAQDNGLHVVMQGDQTRAEAQQRADMMFKMLDANKDGTLTKVEADETVAQLEAARDDDQGGGRMQRMIDRAFGSAQSLTLVQFETQALARFDAADLNHDGTVTVAEREQLRAQRQAQGAAASVPAKPQ